MVRVLVQVWVRVEEEVLILEVQSHSAAFRQPVPPPEAAAEPPHSPTSPLPPSLPPLSPSSPAVAQYSSSYPSSSCPCHPHSSTLPQQLIQRFIPHRLASSSIIIMSSRALHTEINDDQELKLPKINKPRSTARATDKFVREAVGELPRIHREVNSSTNVEYPDRRLDKDRLQGLQDVHETRSNQEVRADVEEEQAADSGKKEKAHQQQRRQTEHEDRKPTTTQQQQQYQGEFDPQLPQPSPTPSAPPLQLPSTPTQTLDRDSFVKDVQAKLQAISQQHIPDPNAENAQSDMSDFQQKVKENRELIKKEVFKKKGSVPKKETKKPVKRRNQSLYEKRVREYKENSENKYLLQKKKELAIQELREKLRSERDQSAKQHTQDRRTPNKPKRSKSKGALVLPVSPKQTIRKDLLKPTALKNQDANFQLFQDIHSILKNPHKSRSQFLSLNKLKAQSPSRKANLSQAPSLTPAPIKKLGEFQLLDWRRVSINPQRIVESVESSFANQVQRIGSFISKNEKSIESFVKNRELLMEIELQNRMRELGVGRKEREKDREKEGEEEAERVVVREEVGAIRNEDVEVL